MSGPAALVEAGNRLCLQEQSPLFNKLSPEIRQMIYSHVIAGHCFYIIQRRSGLAHVRRRLSRFEIPIELSSEAFLRGAQSYLKARLPSLLRTCHAVYAETVHLLYSGNTFDTWEIVDFVSLMVTPTQQRLHSIRKITASWEVSAKQRENGSSVIESAGWEKAWSILSQMKNLRELAVELYFYARKTSPYSEMTTDEAKARFMPNEREILRLPWTLKLSQKWKLHVNWPQCVMDDFDDAPFTIERTYTPFWTILHGPR